MSIAFVSDARRLFRPALRLGKKKYPERFLQRTYILKHVLAIKYIHTFYRIHIYLLLNDKILNVNRATLLLPYIYNIYTYIFVYNMYVISFIFSLSGLQEVSVEVSFIE